MTSFTSPSHSAGSNQFDQTLDHEELIDIAKAHPDVEKWLISHELVDTRVRSYLYNLWEIILTTTNGTKLVDVIITISDITGLVTNMSYLSYVEDSNTYDQESEIIAQGLEYFRNDSNYNYFVTNNYEIGAGIDDDTNIFGVHGRNGTNQVNTLRFRADIAFNSTPTGEYSFNTIKLTSDAMFGDMILDRNDVMEILANQSIVNEFTSQYPDYDERIKAVRWYDNPITNHDPGYFYEIKYYGDQFYFEYRDNELVSVDSEEIGFRIDDSVNLIFTGSDSINILMDPMNGDVLDIDGKFLSVHSIDEIITIAFQDIEIKDWISEIQRFEGELIYDVNGVYLLTINPSLTSGFGRIIINDTSGLVIEKRISRSVPATQDPDEVLNEILQNDEIEEFYKLNDVVNHTILYDTTETWIVEFYNPIIPQNTAHVKYNDSSGEILEVNMSVLEIQPTLLTSDIINLVLASSFHEHYFIYPESEIVIYYNVQDYWSVYIYSSIFPENYYRVLIDDKTKEVFSETKFHYTTFNQSSLNEASITMNEMPLVKDFKQNYPEAYETIYFDGNWIYYAEIIQSQLLVNQLTITLDDELKLDNSLLEQRVIGSFYVNSDTFVYHNDEFRNYQKMINTKIVEIIDRRNFYLLPKLFSFLLTDLVPNDYNPINLDDNSSGGNDFGVPIYAGFGIIVVAVIIALVKYRQKRSVA